MYDKIHYKLKKIKKKKKKPSLRDDYSLAKGHKAERV